MSSKLDIEERWAQAIRLRPRLLELHLQPTSFDSDDLRLELRLVLGAEPPGTIQDVLEIRCRGVEGLHLDEVHAGMDLGPLVLEDVAARGWDRVKYRVSDPEQDDVLHFNCEDIEWSIRAASPADRSP